MDINMRQKTRAGRSSQWKIETDGKPSLNSKQLHGGNSKRTILKAKTLAIRKQINKTKLKSKGIGPRKGFPQENTSASEPAGGVGKELGCENGGEPTTGEAMIAAAGAQRYIAQEDRHLASRHPAWAVEGIGETVYKYTLWILRWGRK